MTGIADYRVELLPDAELASWDSFVMQHPWGTPGHLVSWKQMLEGTFDHIQGKILVLRDASTGQLMGGVPVFCVKSWFLGTRLVSVPFFAYADPLVASTTNGSGLKTLLTAIVSDNSVRSVQIKCRYPAPALQDLGFVQTGSYLHHTVPLEKNPEEVWRRLSATDVRRYIKKARKMGIQVRDATSRDDVLKLHQLVLATRRRLGLPPLPRHLFESLWDHLGSDRRHIFLASYQGRDVAGIGGLVLRDTFYWEFSGNVPGAEARCAAPLALWTSMQWACEAGLKHFSLGRTDPSNEGLLYYKRHWAPQEEELAVWERSSRARASTAAAVNSRLPQAARWLFRHAPSPLYGALGRLFYRHWG